MAAPQQVPSQYGRQVASAGVQPRQPSGDPRPPGIHTVVAAVASRVVVECWSAKH